MKKSLLYIAILFGITIYLPFVNIAQAAAPKVIKTSTTINVPFSSGCAPTLLYSNPDGSWIGNGAAVGPDKSLQIKVRWKSDTCKTVKTVNIGYIEANNKGNTKKFNKCAKYDSMNSESVNGVQYKYFAISTNTGKNGSSLWNWASVGDSSSYCPGDSYLNPTNNTLDIYPVPPDVTPYVASTGIAEISTQVKEGAKGGGTTDTTKTDPSTDPNTPPNNSVPNDKINTDTGVSFNNLDESLGNFFNPLKIESVPDLLGKILDLLFILIGIASVIVIVIAGFRMVTSNGNPAEITKAKQAITWAIVGLIVSLLSFSIVAIIQNLISR